MKNKSITQENISVSKRNIAIQEFPSSPGDQEAKETPGEESESSALLPKPSHHHLPSPLTIKQTQNTSQLVEKLRESGSTCFETQENILRPNHNSRAHVRTGGFNKQAW